MGLHQVTPLGVVFLFMLVNWWVEKHQRFFLFNVYKRFLFWSRFLRFLTFFYFFSGTFFYIYDQNLLMRAAAYAVQKLLNEGKRAERQLFVNHLALSE